MYSAVNRIIQNYSDKKYSYITGNGTSAIYLAFKSSGLPEGSKVAIPNIACPDPAYAVIWAGYKPVFIDVNTDDYNMDPEQLEEALKVDRQIRAIVAIHLFGNACDIVAIQKLAQKYKCFLLEDCAQSFGNEITEGKLGSFGDVSVFSFGHGKIVEVGHGGSIQSDDEKIMERIKSEYMKLHKYNENKIENLSKIHRKIYYILYSLGLKYSRLNILNLVYVYFFKHYYLYKIGEEKIGLIRSALDNFETDKKNRIEKVYVYMTSLQGEVEFPVLNNQENVLSRLTVRAGGAEKLSQTIRDQNIPSNTMYPMLVDRFKLFFNQNNYSNSFYLKGKMLNLWTAGITNVDIDMTVNIIKEYND